MTGHDNISRRKKRKGWHISSNQDSLKNYASSRETHQGSMNNPNKYIDIPPFTSPKAQRPSKECTLAESNKATELQVSDIMKVSISHHHKKQQHSRKKKKNNSASYDIRKVFKMNDTVRSLHPLQKEAFHDQEVDTVMTMLVSPATKSPAYSSDSDEEYLDGPNVSYSYCEEIIKSTSNYDDSNEEFSLKFPTSDIESSPEDDMKCCDGKMEKYYALKNDLEDERCTDICLWRI